MTISVTRFITSNANSINKILKSNKYFTADDVDDEGNVLLVNSMQNEVADVERLVYLYLFYLSSVAVCSYFLYTTHACVTCASLVIDCCTALIIYLRMQICPVFVIPPQCFSVSFFVGAFALSAELLKSYECFW